MGFCLHTGHWRGSHLRLQFPPLLALVYYGLSSQPRASTALAILHMSIYDYRQRVGVWPWQSEAWNPGITSFVELYAPLGTDTEPVLTKRAGMKAHSNQAEPPSPPLPSLLQQISPQILHKGNKLRQLSRGRVRGGTVLSALQ